MTPHEKTPPPLNGSDATNPLDPDTDDDGLPDGWERAHGHNANDMSDASSLFPDSSLTNLEAFGAGVQGHPNATLTNLDGDDLTISFVELTDEFEVILAGTGTTGTNPVTAQSLTGIWKPGEEALISLSGPSFTYTHSNQFTITRESKQILGKVGSAILYKAEGRQSNRQGIDDFYGGAILAPEMGVGASFWEELVGQNVTCYNVEAIGGDRSGRAITLLTNIYGSGTPKDEVWSMTLNTSGSGASISKLCDGIGNNGHRVLVTKGGWVSVDAKVYTPTGAELPAPAVAPGDDFWSEDLPNDRLIVSRGPSPTGVYLLDAQQAFVTCEESTLEGQYITAATQWGAFLNTNTELWIADQSHEMPDTSWMPLEDWAGEDIADLVTAGWTLKLSSSNPSGGMIVQLEKDGFLPKVYALLPVEIQVLKPGSGWISAQELKIAKWEDAWDSVGQFRQDFIDAVVAADIDRFRIRIDIENLPETYRKFYVSSKGSEAEYNDNATEVLLTKHLGAPNLGIRSDGFLSKEMILVADEEDNKFTGDNIQNDQTHIVALEGDVEFRISEPTGDMVATLPVKKKGTINVKSYIVSSNGQIQMDLLERAWNDIQVANEIYAQIGLKVNADIEFVSAPIGVDLNDGLTLSALPNSVTTLGSEGLALLETLATPDNQTDVVGIYVDAVIHTDIVFSGRVDGIAFPFGWQNAGDFKRTFLVTLDNDRYNVGALPHELGHILLDFVGGDLSNHFPENGNLMRASGTYQDDPYTDRKRLTKWQEEQMFKFDAIQKN